MMKRKSFTIIEVLIAVVVLAILSSVGIVTWRGVVDRTELNICQQNQMMLKEALKLYITDNEAVPVSLSELIPIYTDFAIARLKKDRPHHYLMRKIYLAIININQTKTAWALPLFRDYVGMNTTILRCPAKTGPGLSYGFNNSLKNPGGGKTVSEESEYLVSNDLPIICDCDNVTFSVSGNHIIGAAYRHGKGIIKGEGTKAVIVFGQSVRVVSKGCRDYEDAPVVKSEKEAEKEKYKSSY